MPVWLRSFTYNKLKEAYEREQPKAQTLDEQAQAIKSGEIQLPDHSVSMKPKPNIKY
jgi:hypothetical protein